MTAFVAPACAVALAFLPLGAAGKASDTGVWSAAGNLIVGRVLHTATFLPNGEVLVAGGADDHGKGLASSELFDPQTGNWAPAGNMITSRVQHTATLLQDGRVLVVGGFSQPDPVAAGRGGTLASAELYDPKADRWTAAASMLTPRARHTATLLQNGKVLVVGGINITVQPSLVSAFPPPELYDSSTNTWSLTGPGADGRVGHTATLLPGGKVLVSGGLAVCPNPTTQLYDPISNTWSAAAEMSTPRSEHTATLLPGARVLAIGGMRDPICTPEPISVQEPLPTAELYDARRNLWSSLPPMRVARAGHTATLLGNGLVLVAGGAYSGDAPAVLWDPATNGWLPTGGPIDRYAHTASLLRDGRMLIAGGYGIGSATTALLFDPNPAQRPQAPLRWSPGEVALTAALLVLLGAFLRRRSLWVRLQNLWRSRASDDWCP